MSAGAAAFYALAALTLVGAVATVTRRNLVSAAVCLIGTFFGLAGIYLLLYAPFLAVLQLLVYAGAIMTLFVFVVMILGREELEPVAPHGIASRALGVGAVAFIVARLIPLLGRAVGHAELPTPDGDFGGVRAVGRLLLSEHVLPFEVVSLVLLVAVVGALLLAGPRRPAPAPAPAEEPRG